MDLPSIQVPSNQIRHSLGDAFLSMNTSPLNDELSQSSPPTRPGENTGSSQAALPHLPEWNSDLLRLVEKGKSPGNWTVTLLNQTITEILVMIDPRPTIVPGEPGLLSLPS